MPGRGPARGPRSRAAFACGGVLTDVIAQTRNQPHCTTTAFQTILDRLPEPCTCTCQNHNRHVELPADLTIQNCDLLCILFCTAVMECRRQNHSTRTMRGEVKSHEIRRGAVWNLCPGLCRTHYGRDFGRESRKCWSRHGIWPFPVGDGLLRRAGLRDR